MSDWTIDWPAYAPELSPWRARIEADIEATRRVGDRVDELLLVLLPARVGGKAAHHERLLGERGDRPVDRLIRAARSERRGPSYSIPTPRAARIATTASEIEACSIERTFAQGVSTGVSVGEKAVLVLNARKR